MWLTCMYAYRMAKMIQLRNVPDELHRLLKARAAVKGLSLCEYRLAELRRSAQRSTTQELQARHHGRTPVMPDVSPAEVIRALRDQP
jgi:antitoxin FitA